jgi:hypothetical protein
MKLFGKILNHKAGFGEEKSEKEEWNLTFKNTGLIWQKEFNEPYSRGLLGKAKVCGSNKFNDEY